MEQGLTVGSVDLGPLSIANSRASYLLYAEAYPEVYLGLF